MSALLAITADSVAPRIEAALERVQRRFNEQLESTIEPVAGLCRYIERYRGKMLRPTMVLVSGLAASNTAADGAITEAHIVTGAVVEMIHMATLVHDDVLDEAKIRRRAETVNRLHGNEAAVILGDYLISQSFHLCSMLDSQRTALRIGFITSTVCEGELLQLFHRGDFALPESTYFEIIGRKTASLIGVSCELGAAHSGASDETAARFYDFGYKLGLAFQIQDDLLDLIGAEGVVGKSLGKDLEKGKLTLPLIHHLSRLSQSQRERAIASLRSINDGATERAGLSLALAETGSIEFARTTAADLVGEAKALMAPLADTPARASILALADAVISREF